MESSKHNWATISETKSTGNPALSLRWTHKEDTLLLYYVRHTNFKGGSAFRLESCTSGEVRSLSPAPTVWI